MSGSVLVIGGGIAGIQASLDLAEAGVKVYLAERSPSVGGRMAQLDKTFPTNDCSMCILSPKLVEVGRHPNVEILTRAEVIDLKGGVGNFKATVHLSPRYVDMEKCIACGKCAEKCPAKTDNEFDAGLTKRKAIYVPFPQAVPLKYAIDEEKCIYLIRGKCRICEKVCPAEAINFEDKAMDRVLEVDAVIASTGFDTFSPEGLHELGYSRFPNVITSMEFERQLAPTGPTGGHILRPSDNKGPARVAFIQCVGSRDPHRGHGYCSSVCCMYSIKEAMVAREHLADLESHIYYMDMRTYGKEFDAYRERAEREGIKFIRSRVPEVEEIGDNTLALSYLDESNVRRVGEYDMVVLACGIEIPSSALSLAKALGVEIEEHGFLKTSEFHPVSSTREGVFGAGVFTGPKDIPDTVAQASSAAAGCLSVLAKSGKDVVDASEESVSTEKDVSNLPPRIGVLVCHCGINIGSIVDVPDVAKFAGTLPNVVFADEVLYACSQDVQERIKDLMEEHQLTRFVVASCTPRTHEPLFQNTLEEANYNPYLFEMTNIREHCSWVHREEPQKATEKAKELVRAAVAKAAHLYPLTREKIAVNKTAMVIGGGPAGMTSAKEIADQGFEVHLMEKEGELGGNLRHVMSLLSGNDPQEYLRSLISKVESHEKITVHKSVSISNIDGYVGNFKTTYEEAGMGKELEHGVVVVATGGEVYSPTEYLYGTDERVVTQLELEERLKRGVVPKSVVMIQCVGSRTDERDWCSKVCCSNAVKNALAIKDRDPEAQVYILFRDIRTYGFAEDKFREARDKGVVFIRWEKGEEPKVQVEDGQLTVEVFERIIRRNVKLRCDNVVLSTGIGPHDDAQRLGMMLKVPLNRNMFFLEAHMKLRPVDFATEGVFLCGLAHSPKPLDESISQALAAAARAAIILNKDFIEAEGITSVVNPAECRGCGFCVEVCPYDAIGLVEYNDFGHIRMVAKVNDVLCKGCGACAASCLSGAVSQKKFDDVQLLSMVDALTDEWCVKSKASKEGA